VLGADFAPESSGWWEQVFLAVLDETLDSRPVGANDRVQVEQPVGHFDFLADRLHDLAFRRYWRLVWSDYLSHRRLPAVDCAGKKRLFIVQENLKVGFMPMMG
jgi:hypothetical protein